MSLIVPVQDVERILSGQITGIVRLWTGVTEPKLPEGSEHFIHIKPMDAPPCRVKILETKHARLGSFIKDELNCMGMESNEKFMVAWRKRNVGGGDRVKQGKPCWFVRFRVIDKY